MAGYDFLALTNEICGRLNETKLTDTTFPTAINFYATIKDSINAAIRDINHQQYSYPFNHNVAEIVLDVGVARYPIPQNAKLVEFETVKILRNTELNTDSRVLNHITYNEYLKNHFDNEINTAETGSIPLYIAKTKTNDFVIAPKPNKAYELELEYFIIPADLDLYDDVPTIPESFKHVIIDGALYHCYMFRDNAQSAGLTKQKFDEGLKAMRSLLVNEYVYLSDTRINRSGSSYTIRVN